MGLIVNPVTSGGLPVVEVTSGAGAPYEISTDGVTGVPVTFGTTGTPLTGVGQLTPPSGYVFLVDSDGAYLGDSDGLYLVEAI